MLTRRQVVIDQPFQDRRYTIHRKKVQSASPRIDATPPPRFGHLAFKMKKLRLEGDRQERICRDNLRLVHRLAIIMRTKRMDDLNTSSRGPFEKKRRKKLRKSGGKPDSDHLDQNGTTTFLQKVTEEALKRTPLPKRKIVQHRAPLGFCTVPQIGAQFASSLRFSSHKHFIQSDFARGKIHKGSSSTSEGYSLSPVECHNKSVQISLTDFNPNSDTDASVSTTSVNCRMNTLDEADGFEDYSEDSSEDDDGSDEDVANELLNQDETPSSEAGDDTIISCSGFTEVESTNSRPSNGAGESRENTGDTDEQLASILLGPPAPSITIDEPSDDDFFNT